MSSPLHPNAKHLARSIVLSLLFVTMMLTAPEATSMTANDDAEAAAESQLSGLHLRGIGPALMSGRIADIAIDPTDRSTWYIAVGSGGVWKTANAGISWKPLFDSQTSYSIGCITLDPKNANTVWVGTEG